MINPQCSNNPYPEQISMVQKMFQPLKLDFICINITLSADLWRLVSIFCLTQYNWEPEAPDRRTRLIFPIIVSQALFTQANSLYHIAVWPRNCDKYSTFKECLVMITENIIQKKQKNKNKNALSYCLTLVSRSSIHELWQCSRWHEHIVSL